jgi:hypothetical protein
MTENLLFAIRFVLAGAGVAFVVFLLRKLRLRFHLVLVVNSLGNIVVNAVTIVLL